MTILQAFEYETLLPPYVQWARDPEGKLWGFMSYTNNPPMLVTNGRLPSLRKSVSIGIRFLDLMEIALILSDYAIGLISPEECFDLLADEKNPAARACFMQEYAAERMKEAN